MKHTVEFLHHFTCEKCSGWWSIASHKNYSPTTMFCPMCGHKQETDELIDIKNGDRIIVTMDNQLINDTVRINVLKEEAEYYRTLFEDHDTGHIRTAVNFIENRIEHLQGKKMGWPFD